MNENGFTDRLQRTEDELAFVQHDYDQVNTQIVDMHQTIARLSERVRQLEERLRTFENQMTPVPDMTEERPPHSVG